MKTIKEVIAGLTEADIGTIEKLSKYEAQRYIVNQLGNDSEKYEARLGLLPLWAKQVMDELKGKEGS